eukprot:jgi/Astpho2/5200/Aster-04779
MTLVDHAKRMPGVASQVAGKVRRKLRKKTRRHPGNEVSAESDEEVDDYLEVDCSDEGGVVEELQLPAEPQHAAPPPSQPASTSGNSEENLEHSDLPEHDRHDNGVTIFEELDDTGEHGGALMVSAVVRAPPETCFHALMDMRYSDRLASMSKVIRQDDPHTRILKSLVVPYGWLRRFAAPRETVTRQVWRLEEDGCYILLSHSVEDEAAPEHEPSLWNWFVPVRAQVVAAGWTVSPLLPKFTDEGRSAESLVTLVFKVDLQGWLSLRSGGIWGRLLASLRGTPLGQSVRNRYLGPLLMSLVTLRDQVEQERFVVQPFSMLNGRRSTDNVDSAADSPAPEERKATASPRSPPVEPNPTVEPNSTAEETPAAEFPGPSYTCDPKDHKKFLSEEPAFTLLSADLVAVDHRIQNVARYLPSVRNSKKPFVFLVQVMFARNPMLGLVMAWASDKDPAKSDKPHEEQTPFERCLQEFLGGDDSDPAVVKKRHSMLKLIPSVVKGSWIIKQSVGNTPVLLGTKVKTTYHRGPTWFEVDIDVDSSSVASHVVGMVKGVTTSFVIDMGIVLQGNTRDCLPEQLLGTIRFSNLDLRLAKHLDPLQHRQLSRMGSSSGSSWQADVLGVTSRDPPADRQRRWHARCCLTDTALLTPSAHWQHHHSRQ